MHRRLDQVRPGQSAQVVAVGRGDAVRGWLLALGLTPHTPVTVIRTAPLGDPLELSLRGYSLYIRKSEAAHVLVTVGEE